jgi:formylglycine-generating enzyme required for sulfatase activity
MRLALIAAGLFRMGSPRNEKARDEDELAHEVEITKPFYLSIFPVTQAQYQAIMGNNPSHFRPDGDGSDMVEDLDTQHHPAEWMSYSEARTFCRKLTQREEETNAKRKYRLPTEAEWEYACRGGSASTQPFHVGARLSSTHANFDGELPYGSRAAGGPALERPCPVGLYPPNVFGIHDMHGNVHEWCSDWYDDEYYEDSPRKDPKGPKDGDGRVQRGGCWRCPGHGCRAAARASDEPNVRDLNTGFRVVCEA